ncbi:MAG: Com family DNA-binding transcriptional regulator [Marinobacter sp.]|uniref:Com family DNA-binding transcriptional regulator n=1 Tax=Marinobacter sp. TaxID=50741 RepID=UPI00299DDACC|nr:Com family DNA-binding transcriptional regulator [Marinobacter sp.]MDX1755894.1 Com family DNA-binding transcriptional regulator [Marinobacter sp.]
MQKIRCGNCNKLLAKAIYQQLEIKCPRCGRINERTGSPMEKDVKYHHGQTSRTLDRR